MVALSALALAVSVLATVTDLLERKIFNWLTLPALGLGVALHATPGAAPWWTGLAGSLAVGLPFFVLYATGVMKPGDVKLLMALGAILGPRQGIEIGVASIMLHGPISLALLVGHRRLGNLLAMWRAGWSSDRALLAPYGFSIALAVFGSVAYHLAGRSG